jgi:hypothetical protein
MKFYRDIHYSFDYWCKIYDNKFNAIYIDNYLNIRFFKNGMLHNEKNAAISGYKRKEFYLNDKCYGDQYDDFTKKSWHRFVKLQAFL